MKKVYMKPSIELMEYTVNEAIAGNCGIKVYNHTTESCSNDPTAEWVEITGMIQANIIDDLNCTVPVDGYCYFTSNGTGTFIFNS